MPGLFEVRFRTPDGVQVVYADATGTYVIQGKIYDLRTDRDLTEERLRKLNAIKFESLPLDLAIKVQRGNGKRVIAMFSDPYCPACRQFERLLAQIDNITVYVFMYPVIRPENADHSRMVWCAQDRAKAWLELRSRAQAEAARCGQGLRRPGGQGAEARRSLGVNSTPTLILANGERLAGGLSAPRSAESPRPGLKSEWCRRGISPLCQGRRCFLVGARQRLARGHISHILPCWRACARPSCRPRAVPQ